MSREYAAPPQVTAQVPAYVVREYDGPPVERELCRFDDREKIIIKEKVLLEGGYMVYFAKGHSSWYPDLNALAKAGLSEIVPLIQHGMEAEMNKDIPVPTTQRQIEKSRKEKD